MKVFISYVREDLGIAKKLYHDLKNAGLVPWMDMEDLLPGQTWEFEIDKAIEASSYFLILLSSNSVTKKGVVQKEVRKALEKFKECTPGETYIIPVRLDDCKPAYKELHAIHWADIFPSYEHGFGKIKRALLQDQENRNLKTERQEVQKNEESTIIIDKPANDVLDKKFTSTKKKSNRTNQSSMPRTWMSSLVLALLITGTVYTMIRFDAFRKIFQETEAKTYALTVKPEPSDAAVRIMNISESYRPGMLLKSGSYDIQVSKVGYKTFREKKEIADSDMMLPIPLEKIPEPPPPKPPEKTDKPVANSSKYRLRKEPITVSGQEALKVFKLKEDKNGWLIPLDYIQNDFKENRNTITDHATGLMWQKSGSDEYMPYKEAQVYIEGLNRKIFAGFSDWRLPTVDELKSLLTPKEMNGDLYIDPIFDKTQRYCWTSDLREFGDGVWRVGFDCSDVRWSSLYGGYYVRAVRSVQLYKPGSR